MQQTENLTPNRLPWPPILYGVTILAGFVLQYVYPLTIYPAYFSALPVAFGGLFIFGGLLIDVLAIRELGKHKTTVLPHKGADHLVTSGPFSVSRNPIYVGNTMLTAGLGLFFNNLWLIPGALIAAMAVNHLAIKREEAHLATKFGKNWHTYKKKVKRWV